MMNDALTELEISALFEDLAPEAPRRAAVIVGRFNPPTVGHYSVIDRVKAFIRKNKDLDIHTSPIVVIIGGSQSDSDKKRNPLTVAEREAFMKSSGKANGVIFTSAPNAFAAFAKVRELGYEPIAIAAGSDRADDYLRILDKNFTKVDGAKIKHYKIKLDRAESAVENKKQEKMASMDEILKSASNGIEIDVVSGSLARRAVALGYEEEFAKIVGLEEKPALAKKMFKKIKDALGE